MYSNVSSARQVEEKIKKRNEIEMFPKVQIIELMRQTEILEKSYKSANRQSLIALVISVIAILINLFK